MGARAKDNIQQLVLNYGRDRAREMVDARDRLLVDVAAEVLSDDQQRIGISYTGFCLTSLPHKRLADDQIWERRGHRVTLVVEPGTLLDENGKAYRCGVPFGARARMILLYLQTQAVRTGSREIELGRSMRGWMDRMGLSTGGETARSLREQAARISACSLKFFWEGDDASRWARGGIVAAGLRFHAEEEGLAARAVPRGAQVDRPWDDRVVLDEVFWEALKKHPVPLQEAALRQLAHRSLALDVYIWLAWRCHQLARPTPITWAALAGQFNTADQPLRRFKPVMAEALRAAATAYPSCRVEVGDAGVTLHPSAPPVPRLVA